MLAAVFQLKYTWDCRLFDRVSQSTSALSSRLILSPNVTAPNNKSDKDRDLHYLVFLY